MNEKNQSSTVQFTSFGIYKSGFWSKSVVQLLLRTLAPSEEIHSIRKEVLNRHKMNHSLQVSLFLSSHWLQRDTKPPNSWDKVRWTSPLRMGESARPGPAFRLLAIQEMPLPLSYNVRLPLVYNPSGPLKFASVSLPWQAWTGWVGVLHLSLISTLVMRGALQAERSLYHLWWEEHWIWALPGQVLSREKLLIKEQQFLSFTPPELPDSYSCCTLC